jgi:two-component system chemotaxis sensor kinase CheA
VVAFTHEVETLLEGLRSGTLPVTDPISAALLEGLDQMAALLDEVRTGRASAAVAERSQVLGARLRQLHGAHGAHGADSPAPHADAAHDAAAALDSPLAAPTGAAWHLSLRFGADALRNGLDPLAFIRYLGTLGRISGCEVVADVPALADLDAEACHLGFELGLLSTATQADIEQVFEFALDDCSLQIVPPASDGSAFEALLDLRCAGDGDSAEALLATWARLGVGMGQLGDEAAPDQVDAAADADAAAAAADVSAASTATPPTAPAATSPVADRRTGRDRRTPAEARFVKVRADKLDHLIDLIGELVIAGSGAQMVASQEGSAVFLEASQRVSELVQATRDGALALRMVPVGETFSRFQRVVRDTSKQLGKEIEFIVTGGETELDKSMVELIADPLMHLVRNSLDHGIELPAEREAAGKGATGRLQINACHEGGSIVIEVSDDGRGLRRERILAKAIERGLLPEGAAPSDAEVWQLIFAPGFSTADKVTDLSGRGVGMDVVKRNIEALRGQIALSSVEGQGTRTQIRLPLTLAMIDGFLTLVGGVHYVLPLAVVSECIALPRECLAAPGRTCGTFDLRGEVLPYIDLALFYGVGAGTAATADDEAQRRSLVVVRDGAVRVGLVVDRLLGEHQTVIKPLAGIFRHLKALAGSTILGSGDVALVLDMQGLLAAALQATQPARTAVSLNRPALTR